jgi:hypothetical protein
MEKSFLDKLYHIVETTIKGGVPGEKEEAHNTLRLGH